MLLNCLARHAIASALALWSLVGVRPARLMMWMVIETNQIGSVSKLASASIIDSATLKFVVRFKRYDFCYSKPSMFCSQSCPFVAMTTLS